MSLTEITGSARPATAGIDWANDNHAVCVVDADGEPVDRATIAHSKAGIAVLIKILARHHVREVAIERPDGPVVDAVLAAGLAVFVIPPAQIKALRKRYGSAGNKDDRFDAYVLADTLRTDGHRWNRCRRIVATRRRCGRCVGPGVSWWRFASPP